MLNRQSWKAALTPTTECLSVEQLERLLSGSAQNEPHLAKCARCQAELAMLKSFGSETHLPDEGAAVAWISSQLERRFDEIKTPARSTGKVREVAVRPWFARISHFGKLRFVVPVAASIAVFAASLLLLRSSKEPALQAQLETRQTILRSEEIETLGPAGELMKAPTVLQWKGIAGAAKYKVVLMEVDHSPLWSSETVDNLVTIPNPVRSKLHRRKPVLWQVVALDAQGRELAASQLQRFVVVRTSNSDGPSGS